MKLETYERILLLWITAICIMGYISLIVAIGLMTGV